MNLSLSAGGTPEQTKTTLRSQTDAQLGSESKAVRDVGDAVLAHIAEGMADVPADASVSVSASVYVSVYKPVPSSQA